MDPAQTNPPQESFPPPPPVTPDSQITPSQPVITPPQTPSANIPPTVTPPIPLENIPNPAVQTPQISSLTESPIKVVPADGQIPPNRTEVSKNRSGLKIFGILFALFIFIILGSFTAAYLVATEKIPSPNPQIKQVASSVIFSIPFIPKTPGYVIDSFITNTKSYSSSSFDLSIAATSSDFQSLVGGSNFDLRASGFADLSNIDKPQSEVTLQISNFLDAEIKQTSERIYFKVNKIPTFLYLFIGLSPEHLEPIFNDWIHADISTLDTQARDLVNSSATTTSPFDEVTLTAFKKVFTEDVRPHIKLTPEQLDGVKTYKLEFSPTPEQLDTIVNKLNKSLESPDTGDSLSNLEEIPDIKPSQLFSSVRFQAWIDYDNRLRKISLNSTYNPKALEEAYPPTIGITGTPMSVGPSLSSPVTIAAVLSVSDFDKLFTVTPPETSISSEEFLSKINQLFLLQMSEMTASESALPTPTAEISL